MDADVHAVSVPAAGAIPALPFLPVGTRLEPGGVYLDLARSGRGPFVALLGQIAGSGNRYVAQRDLSARHWCRLVKAAAHASAPSGLPRHQSLSAGAGTELRFAGAAPMVAAP